MRWNEINTMTCSVARTLSVVGDRWTMLIIRDAFLGIRRFEGMLQRDLRHDASSSVGSSAQAGARWHPAAAIEYQKRPRRFEYRLTEKGIDLYPLIVAMIAWGDRWMAGRKGAPVELVHRPCGHAINPELTCPQLKAKR